MPDKEAIAIIGYSGHSFVVLDAAVCMGLDIKYYCEKSKLSDNPFKLIYLGDESSTSFDWDSINQFVLAVGDNKIRQKVADRIVSKNKKLLNIVHPSAIISNYTTFGNGNFVAANVAVNPLAKIENNCILNTGCIIEHECVIENGVHIAPGAVLAGNVSVGKSSFVGANSVVKQGVKIGNNVIIGAGSVVIHDIPDNETWVGNPAKKLK